MNLSIWIPSESAGLRVVMVEEGAYRTSEDFTLREPATLARMYRDGGAMPTEDQQPGTRPNEIGTLESPLVSILQENLILHNYIRIT